MRIGIGIEGKNVEQAVSGARAARDRGFASVWFSNIFALDALTVCAVAGAAVPDITVGTAVVPTYPRHPFAMAQQAATTHDAAGGRLVLGIGLSHQVVIENLLGMSFERPARHMREYLSVLVPLLRDGKVKFQGECYSVNATLERPAGGPPVVIAALGPTMLKIAGELADGTATWMTGLRTLADHVVPSLTAAADAAGRPAPRIVAGLPVAVTADPAGARQAAGEIFSMYGQLPSYRAMLDREGAAGPGDVAVVGDEAAIGEAVRRFADAGVTDFNAVAFGDRAQRDRTVEVLAAIAQS
jgi:F420-dependent oxidoreductase-like protein